MKKILIAVALIGFVLGTVSCDQSGKATNGQETPAKKAKYICTMHPSVGADSPGVCPKCGMQLVERDTTEDK